MGPLRAGAGGRHISGLHPQFPGALGRVLGRDGAGGRHRVVRAIRAGVGCVARRGVGALVYGRQAEYRVELPGPARQRGRVRPSGGNLGRRRRQHIRTLTFSELRRETDRLANALRALDLAPGDRVALYMPMVPEVVMILYACFKLGLVAVPIFSGFGYGATAVRLQDSGARVLFTSDFLERRGRRSRCSRKPMRRWPRAVPSSGSSSGATRAATSRGIDVWWHDFVAGQPEQCAALPLDSEAPGLLLYTSGTTGRPKGAVHTHAGALAQTAKEIYLTFDRQPDDRFWWVSDIGWMMGPWEILGNHHLGGAIVMYDGAPDHPTPERFWQMIERHRVTTFGISPTAIRLLMRKAGAGPDGFDLSSLRLLGSTGEPWDESSYRWFFERVGRSRCPIMNISGGTEIIGCFLAPLPIQPLKACSLGGPSPGMATEVFDAQGQPVRGQLGYLVCTKPAPSMTRGVWNDPRRYLEAYWSRWPGVWYHGDWASVDADRKSTR